MTKRLRKAVPNIIWSRSLVEEALAASLLYEAYAAAPTSSPTSLYANGYMINIAKRIIAKKNIDVRKMK